MKKCKQCGKYHDDEMFRQYVPRGTGKYNTKVGRNTICKNCESLNNKAARYYKIKESDRTEEQNIFLDRAADAYKLLKARGNEPIGVYAKVVLGVSEPEPGKSDDDLFRAILESDEVEEQLQTPMMKHMDMIERRLYDSIDDAYEVQDSLKEDLKAAGLYAQADKLLEDWENEMEQ